MSKFSSTIKVRLFGIFALAAVAATVVTQAQTAPQLLPYTSRLIAGGGTATIAAGATCPTSGYKSLDAFGDGCLATEVQLVGPRYAIADSTGAVFVSDYTNGVIRRVDPVSGIITAIAGGAASNPTTCAGAAADALGDGCASNLVKLLKPAGMAFDAAGNLYFTEADFVTGTTGGAHVRRIAATAGFVNGPGVITLVLGQASNAKGYAAGVTAANSYLYAPYDIAFDATGDLLVSEEYKEAILAYNPSATATNTVGGVSLPPGMVTKVLGYATTGGSTCPNAPTSTNGCNYGLSTFNAPANNSLIDNPYGVAVDPSGNVFFPAEYYNFIGKIAAGTNTLTQYAGIQNAAAKKPTTRAPGGTFGIGTPIGITADPTGNIYFSDASSGVIWRVDAATQSQYVVAGGAATVCAAATDSFGDGCPATQSTFGSTGTGNFAVIAAPGIFGVKVDAFADIFTGDTTTNVVREVASGSQFGVVGANQPIDVLDIHFAAGDSPAANAYSITAGAANFTVGSATCTANSDATTDCLLPVTATPTTLGNFTGMLQVKSTLGGIAIFPLSGTYVVTPATRTAVTVNTGVTCAGATSVSTSTPVTLTATVASSGTPTGTVQFFANGAAIGAAQPVSSSSATLKYSFTTPGTYTISATYSGDSYFKTSTGTSTTTVTTTTASYNVTLNPTPESTVNAGGTALYSFSVAQNVFSGTLSFSCSGLPAFATCSFSPATLTGTGCSSTSTVALNIYTQQPTPIKSGSIGIPGRGPWALLGVLPGVLLALGIGLRRRRLPVRFGQIAMAFALLMAASGFVACGSAKTTPGTPAFSGNITVTVSSSTGTPFSLPIPLTIN